MKKILLTLTMLISTSVCYASPNVDEFACEQKMIDRAEQYAIDNLNIIPDKSLTRWKFDYLGISNKTNTFTIVGVISFANTSGSRLRDVEVKATQDCQIFSTQESF
jgi:hypothetical protein